MAQFVEVAFPIPLDSTFCYDLPQELESVRIGDRVLAPFGKRLLTGFVLDRHSQPQAFVTKGICAILDDVPLLTPSLIALARKMTEIYGVPLGDAIQAIIPAGLIRQTRKRVFPIEREGSPLLEKDRTEEMQCLVRIRKSKSLDWATMVRRTPHRIKFLHRLEKEGWIKIESVLTTERAKNRKRGKLECDDPTFNVAPNVVLSDAQEAALGKINAAIEKSQHRRFLLHGITGSGKTEVYLRAAASAVNKGKGVLALVPEISLTPQFVGRFRARFGDIVAVLHSARSENERLFEWKKIRSGKATVVIGARSAIFAPLENIGLIILDEEHDGSYKQEEGFLYNAKTLASIRAKKENSVLLFGSATPSLEIYHEAKIGGLELLQLPDRVTGHVLPSVRIVDLRKEFDAFQKGGLFSKELTYAISETLAKDKQTVLFLNRRGFAPIVLCPTCGESLRCPNCSVSLTYHESDQKHLCHYCGFLKSKTDSCGNCSQSKFVFLGTGTERVEQELRYLFPDAKIGRMDKDTVSRRGSHEKILKQLLKKEIDILIGTQMVTKGIDLENVSLVGVLIADQSLHFPDFRAAEKTFQLLTQVVGRAGRGKERGLAILQTFQPDHYAIVSSATQDYESFFTQEIEYRKQLQYPPYTSLALMELRGKDDEVVQAISHWLCKQARLHSKSQKENFDILGPSPAPVRRINRETRYQILVKSRKTAPFVRWLAKEASRVLKENQVTLKVNLDPYHFL